MKNFLLFVLLLLYLNNFIEAQQLPTNAGIPGPENVLVVYKVPNSLQDTLGFISDSVKEYYKTVRAIPAVNIVPLSLPDSIPITIDNITHWVGLRQGGDNIRDIDNHNIGTWTPTFHAWKFFLDTIAHPIRQHLLNNGLLSKIRYIVLCKGVPFKVQASADSGGTAYGNVTVDGLLSMLNTNNYESFIEDIVYESHSSLSNPYFNADQNLSMNYRFLPDVFNYSSYKLSYLVSHLDGLTYDVVRGIIDRSKMSDMSGTAAWVLDDDPCWLIYLNDLHQDLTNAKNKLENLNFNVLHNDSDIWITNYTTPVIGYSSFGTHSEDYNCNFNDSAWVKDSLKFTWANGAVFNTYESFNGNSLTTLKWKYVHVDNNCSGHTQGLATQFTDIGGTGMMAHGWEPAGGVVKNNIFMPAYAIGYNLVDAIYQGMEKLAHQNVVVGDPLTRIYNYEIKTLASDSTITGGDFTGRLVVPAGKKLTIQAGVPLNFQRNSSLQINGILEVQSGAVLNFDSYSSLVFNTGSSNQILNGVLNFRKKARLELNNDFTLTNSSSINFFDESYLNATSLTTGSGEFLTFNGNSNLLARELFLSPGTTLNFNDQCSLKVKNRLTANGTESNKVRVNINNVVHIDSAIQVEIQNVIFTGGKLEIIASNLVEVVNININHVNFIATPNSNITINGGTSSSLCNAFISNVSISGNITTGINLVNLYDTEVRGVTINNTSENIPPELGAAISGLNCSSFKIYDCIINKFKYGISYNYGGRPEEGYVNVYLLLTGNEITNCINGIYINRCTDGFVEISKNNIYSPLRSSNEITTAIVINNSNEVNVESNTIYDFDFGAFIADVTTPYILDNTIQILNASETNESGTFSSSSQGTYLINSISGYKKGIELGNSSPKIGSNTITDNFGTGLYVLEGSFPDLSEGLIKQGEENFEFPISGLNNIFENGGEYEEIEPFNGAEIHMFNSDISLGNGCNTIADNRIENLPVFTTRILLFSDKTRNPIRAYSNYWGDHPEYGHDPHHRIESDVEVNYEPYLEEPCIKTKDGNFIVIKNSAGTTVIDTIFTLGMRTSLDSLKNAYALASKYYFNRDFNEAKQVYYEIIQTHGLDRKSLEAYTKLYTISNLTNAPSTSFTELKTYYDGKLTSIQDTLLFKAVKHLSDLCLVAKQDYAQAINNFSEVIVQNPNSEAAFFAGVDILTTSLLDTGNTALGKIGGLDLSAKNADDYRTKLNALIKARNNKESILTSKVIPTQFLLYQNYPNPFNPTTKIQYDIPTDTKVQLKVYDILGREVKTLVNEYQTAGKYNVEFNARNLASGVYIYQLSSRGFVKSRKMLVIK